jgi:translation initiation factor 1A
MLFILMHGHTHQSKHNKRRNISKELVYKEEGQEYAIINCDKGFARFEVTIFNTKQITFAKARGSLIKGPKKQKLNKGDLVLIVNDESSTDDKYWIIYKYSPDNVKQLQKSGELNVIKNYDEQQSNIIFDSDFTIETNEDDIDISNI